ncbi:MAG: hypothetical protein EZS28_026245, partial [Streblomastix strix]
MINRHQHQEIAVESVYIIFRVLVIAISTASGHGVENDQEISNTLNITSKFLKCLNEGKNYGTQFPPQPLLVRRSDEQIEEEGGNEEIDSQLINKGYSWNIKDEVNKVKGAILNFFIDSVNPKPSCPNVVRPYFQCFLIHFFPNIHPIDSTAWEMEQGITSQSIHITQSINKGEVV